MRLRNREPQLRSVLYKGILLVQSRRRIHIELNSVTGGLLLDDLLRIAILHRRCHTGAADPQIYLLFLDDLKQILRVVAGAVRSLHIG